MIDHCASSGIASFSSGVKRVGRKIIVFLAPRKQRIADVEILPLTQFLKELPG